MQRLISAELISQIASVRKHLPGIHNQKLHGKPIKGVSLSGAKGREDPRVGKFPDDAESPFRDEVHIQRVITHLRTEKYVSRNKKLMVRDVPAYGYVWSDTKDNVTGSDLDHARAVSSKIGPGVDNVRISRDRDSSLLATWTDRTGKLQPVYSTEHNVLTSVQKYIRLSQFELERKKFLDTLDRDIDSKNVKVRECARALYLINATSFLPGDDHDADRETRPTFGATTLRNAHVVVERQEANHRDTTIFNFHTKDNKIISRSVPGNTLARIVREQKGARSPNEKLFPNIKSEDAPIYMRKVANGFTPKDIRTYNATMKALKLVNRQPYKCATVEEFKIKQNHVAELVGHALGVAPRTALKNYIDPLVWDQWRHPHWGPWKPPGLRVAPHG